MEEKNELKVAKSYSLDPEVILWVTKKAARLTMEGRGRMSDSQVVNDLLKDAMEKDNEEQASIPSPADIEKKRKNNSKTSAPRAEAVAA